MNTDEFEFSKNSILEKQFSKIAKMAKGLTPHIEETLNQLAIKKTEFDSKKNEIEQEIDNGARTTKHRLHL